ncbi:MAG: undecaprenyl-phosphate glucose phosphotransferase [Bacteriovoracaceae bacterium]|nr:undecaprenyl-phosphate glucose phosphotransferase [Bacteroidota bacterium]
MNKPRKNDLLIPLLTFVFDIAAFESAFLLSYWLRFFSPVTDYFEITLGVPPIESYVTASIVFIPVFILVFHSRKLYGARRNVHLSDELFVLIRLITIGMMMMMSATFFYREFSFSRGVFILIWGTSITTVSFGRFIVLKLEQWLYKKRKELKTVVIVGKNKTAELIYQLFHNQLALGYEVLGYYAESEAQETSSLSHGKYLGPIAQLPDDIMVLRIQTALLALAHNEQELLIELLRNTEGKNIEFMMVPDMLELMTSRIRIQEIEGIPFIKLKDIPMSTWNKILKRGFDLMFSSVALLFAFPLMSIIAIIIKATSLGPVFYIQERVGLDGVSFPLIKFRSMRIDAEKTTGPIRNKKDDNRATIIGKILRRTSLDELPQLFNVFIGQMSIVGPRPERPFFVEQFKSHIPKYLERHRVKTGMTGWAQVNGLRGDVPIEDRTKFDIYYVENWSLVFDVKIILKTIRAVIFADNAY